MAIQPVTINLPSELYRRLQSRAQETHRTVEAELLDVVATAIYDHDDLPVDLAESLQQLAVLDDETLWRVARSAMPSKNAARLEALHSKQRREGLTTRERAESAQLLKLYEHYMLVRAQAAVFLKQRGYDVTDPEKFRPTS